MTTSLKAKLIAATLTSVATIGALVFVVDYGAGAFSGMVVHSRVITTAVRNHTNADMMRGALRADVFAALQFARTAPERRAEIVAETSEHASEMKWLIASNKALPLSGNVKERLQDLERLLDLYSADAQALVAAAFAEPQKAPDMLGDFERQFTELQGTMATEGDLLAASAVGESDVATSFATQARWVSDAALVLGILIGMFALWVTQIGVVSPLNKLTTALKRFSNGDYEAEVPSLRKDEIGQMARAIEKLGKEVIARNRLGREAQILSELNEWLQSAKSEAELYQMIADFLCKFIPDCGGTIYIYANSRDILECVKMWNGSHGAASMHPDDCWGLRRGRTYTHGQSEIDFDCPHVDPGVAIDYCCVPILAHGETVGLLHLEYKPKPDVKFPKTVIIEQRRLGLAAVEHISLAIANVRLRDQLKDQAIRDTLTGLYNRRYMLETCRREFMRASRATQPVTILSIDVDHFKTFNDNHGHDAGDTVLRAVGEALISTFRGDDVPCRFGGEEFIVLLPNASALIGQRKAEELRAKIERLTVRYADGDLPRITISVGVATYPDAGSTPLEVLKVADNALYAAKAQGRNRVELSPSGKSRVAAASPESPHAKLSEEILDRLAQPDDEAAGVSRRA